MGLGAIAASERKNVLSTAGKPETGKVAIFTNDVTPESTDAIRGGKLVAETHHGFPEWGWFGTQFAVQIACGQTVPETYDIRPRTVYKGNADQFYPDPKLPAIDWDKIKQDCEE
jgi:ribose transport system substrate-binding protein